MYAMINSIPIINKRNTIHSNKKISHDRALQLSWPMILLKKYNPSSYIVNSPNASLKKTINN